jgi:hypothetical protein
MRVLTQLDFRHSLRQHDGPAQHSIFIWREPFSFFFSYIVMFSPKINKMTFSSTFWGHNESTVMRANKKKSKKWPPRTFNIFHSFEWMSRKFCFFSFAKSRAVPKAKHWAAQINENVSWWWIKE